MTARRHRMDDDRLHAALLQYPTLAGAAEAAGCSERTLRRRLAEPAFRARHDQIRSQVNERLLDAIVSVQVAATRRLSELIGSSVDSTALRAVDIALRQPRHDRRPPVDVSSPTVVTDHSPAELLGLPPDVDARTVRILAHHLHETRRTAG